MNFADHAHLVLHKVIQFLFFFFCEYREFFYVHI